MRIVVFRHDEQEREDATENGGSLAQVSSWDGTLDAVTDEDVAEWTTTHDEADAKVDIEKQQLVGGDVMFRGSVEL